MDLFSWGYQLPVQSLSRTFAEDWELTAGARELAAAAQAGDRAGAAYVGVCDHLAIPKPLAEHMRTTWWHTVTTLGYLAAVTDRVGLLSHVTVPAYRHPLDTAKAFCTLDQLSDGRAICGVGAGHVEDEFALLGADFAGRGPQLEEAIAVLRAVFDDEYPTAAGPTWSLSGDAGVGPRPIQDHLPIWVGGSSRAAIRRAAELADGWLPQGTPLAELPGAIGTIGRRREAAGRSGPFAVGGNAGCYVGEPDWDLGPYPKGTPEKLAGILRRFTDAGVTHLQLRFRSRSIGELTDQIEAFGRDVAPLLS